MLQWTSTPHNAEKRRTQTQNVVCSVQESRSHGRTTVTDRWKKSPTVGKSRRKMVQSIYVVAVDPFSPGTFIIVNKRSFGMNCLDVIDIRWKMVEPICPVHVDHSLIKVFVILKEWSFCNYSRKDVPVPDSSIRCTYFHVMHNLRGGLDIHTECAIRSIMNHVIIGN